MFSLARVKHHPANPSQLGNLSVNRYICQAVSLSVIRMSANQSIGMFIKQSVFQSIGISVNQAISPALEQYSLQKFRQMR